MATPDFVDYYDLLMISRNADHAMVAWSVRLMLRRYGPDNAESGDATKFSLVQQAYRTLANPAKRVEYDEEFESHRVAAQGSATAQPAENGYVPPHEAIKILKPPSFRSSITRQHVLSQQQMRRDIIGILYEIQINRPRDPELGRAEVARSLDCTNDELESALWFLREQTLIRTTPSGAYSISSHGILWAESGGVPSLSAEPDDESHVAQGRQDSAQAEVPLPKDTVNRA